MDDLLVFLVHDTNEFTAVFTLFICAAILVGVESHNMISVRTPPTAVALTLVGSVPCGLAAKDSTALDLRGRSGSDGGNDSGGSGNERELHFVRGKACLESKANSSLYMFTALHLGLYL